MKKTAFSARSISPERALMIIRIGIGLTFVIHGYSKLQGGPEQWQWLGQQLQLVGIDLFPVFWGLMATITEFLGGILLLVGLATRLASLFLFFTMAIAFLHKAVIGEGFGEVAYPLSQLILFLSLFLTDSNNQVLFKNQKKQ